MSVVILDNLRSAWNVGSIFRTAVALGFEELGLCGVTMRPPSPKLRETSRGMEDHISWRPFAHTIDGIAHYRSEGYQMVALETGPNALTFADWNPPEQQKIAWVVGNEAKGITEEVLALVDTCVALPMFSDQASINVSCAFSAAAYGSYFKGLKT